MDEVTACSLLARKLFKESASDIFTVYYVLFPLFMGRETEILLPRLRDLKLGYSDRRISQVKACIETKHIELW